MKKKIFDKSNFIINKFNDKRFKISNYLNKLKLISHKNMIKFMILNNIAHRRYIDNDIRYNDIIPFILKRIQYDHKKEYFRSFNAILNYIKKTKNEYE